MKRLFLSLAFLTIASSAFASIASEILHNLHTQEPYKSRYEKLSEAEKKALEEIYAEMDQLFDSYVEGMQALAKTNPEKKTILNKLLGDEKALTFTLSVDDR